MTELDEIKQDVAVLKSEVKNWMDTTTEYRKSLCAKIDAIQTVLTNLNCRVHTEKMNNMNNQIRALWAVSGGIVMAILYEWVKSK